MLMAAAAAVHMDSTRSSSVSPPPWYPPVPVPAHQQATPFEFELHLVAASPSPPPPPTTASTPPGMHHHQPLRPAAARRATRRRRPRPSRKLPTTYIRADPASFRRMVHEVTGADHLPPRPLPPATLCRPAPSRAAAAALTLPTLDTSAFLLGSRNGSAGASVGAAAAPAPLEAAGGGGAGVGGIGGRGYDSGGDGFPTLESWDALLY